MGLDSHDISTPVSFATAPDRYRHWQLSLDGAVATLTLNVDKDAMARFGVTMDTLRSTLFSATRLILTTKPPGV